jgi:hypothetical protein
MKKITLKKKTRKAIFAEPSLVEELQRIAKINNRSTPKLLAHIVKLINTNKITI